MLDSDVRALLNHDPNQVLGRTRSGTMRLRDEQRGLKFEIDLPDSPLGENVREAVRRGDIDGASFRFTVAKDSWKDNLRTVETVRELKDITVATFGAYPAASVELRTKPNPGTAQEAVMGDQPEQQDNKVEERADSGVPISSTGGLHVSGRSEVPMFRTLSEAFEQRGFPGSSASVTWDEFRTLSWSGGTVLDVLNPLRRDGVALGYDVRFAYPAFPSTSVASDVSAVQLLRQASRTLPAGTAVVRPLASVTTKPEVATSTELVSQQLSQVAAIETNIPNFIGNQPLFQSLVEVDLRLSISEGYDSLVLAGIAQAGTLTYGTADILTSVRKGMTQLMTAGYAPDTLIIDAAGAEHLDLLQTSGSEKFWVFGAGSPAGPVFSLNRRVTKAAGTAVVDSQAFGRLYSSPLMLQSFEVDAGATNRRNVRLEASATFGVERLTAGVRIM